MARRSVRRTSAVAGAGREARSSRTMSRTTYPSSGAPATLSPRKTAGGRSLIPSRLTPTIEASVTQGARAATAAARLIQDESPERPGGDGGAYAQRQRSCPVGNHRAVVREGQRPVVSIATTTPPPACVGPHPGFPCGHSLAREPLDITELVPLTWARHGPAGGEGGPTRMGPALVAAAWGRKSPPLHPIYRIVSSAKRKTSPPTRPVTALRVCVRVSNWSEPKRRQLVPPDADRTRSARSRDGTEGPGRGGRSSPCGARMTDRAGSTGARMVCRTRQRAFAIPRGP